MKETLKRYAVSSLVTFGAAFLIALGTQFEGGVAAADLTSSLLFGAVVTAGRSGLKALIEKVLVPLAKKLKSAPAPKKAAKKVKSKKKK